MIATVRAAAANWCFVRSAALQPPNFDATLINDRFTRGIAAVEGCVPRPKGSLCKGRSLRIAAIGDKPV